MLLFFLLDTLCLVAALLSAVIQPFSRQKVKLDMGDQQGGSGSDNGDSWLFEDPLTMVRCDLENDSLSHNWFLGSLSKEPVD